MAWSWSWMDTCILGCVGAMSHAPTRSSARLSSGQFAPPRCPLDSVMRNMELISRVQRHHTCTTCRPHCPPPRTDRLPRPRAGSWD
eukprot:257597-Chlamydomonas_euryale.AAC.2